MRLGQIKWRNAVTAAIFEDGQARPIPEHSLYELICRAEHEGLTLPAIASFLAQSLRVPATPIIPVQPREVWACGCTYESSAVFRDAEQGRGDARGPDAGRGRWRGAGSRAGRAP